MARSTSSAWCTGGTGSAALEGVEATLVLLDELGEEMAAHTLPVHLKVLLPGQISPFEVVLGDGAAQPLGREDGTLPPGSTASFAIVSALTAGEIASYDLVIEADRA